MSDDGPRCDMPGCDALGYGRYRHIHTHEWTDVCHVHKPLIGGSGTGVVCGSSIWFHTVHHAAYPAESPKEVSRPYAFIRAEEVEERQKEKEYMPRTDRNEKGPTKVARSGDLSPAGADGGFDSHPGNWGGAAARSTMAADTKNDDLEPDKKWSRGAILRRFPHTDELTDKQKDLLVAAIRNPDAGAAAAARQVSTGDSHSLDNLLWQIERGAYDADDDHHPRLNQGSAKFKERTLIQRAAIDFHARHPKAFDDLTYQQVADRIAEEQGVTMHFTPAYQAKKEFPDLIKKRRQWYESNEPEAITRLGDGTKERRSDERTLREKLRAAGFDDLPKNNLDGLPTSEKAKERGQKVGLKKAHERAREEGPFGAAADEGDPVPAGGESQATVAEGETVEKERGQTTYKGPEGGLDTTGGRAPKLLRPVRDADDADETVDEVIAQIREEEGVFGERAYERDVNIDSKEDLELEVRRLRMVVSSQGEMLRALRDTLENLTVDVSVGVAVPESEGDDDGS